MVQFHATTIVAVRRSADDICIGGDGQVTMGETTIMKHGAKKVRKIYKNSVVTGFAGSVSDAFSLTEKFEEKLEEHSGNLRRAAVALAQLWRSDKAARNLDALMIAADKESMLEMCIRDRYICESHKGCVWRGVIAMLSKVYTAAISGINAYPVTVDCLLYTSGHQNRVQEGERWL